VARPRWIGTGQAPLDDPRLAGRTAAEQAITGTDPKLLVVFAADHPGLESMVEGIHDVAGGGVPLIGCSTAGEISAAGPDDASVVVMAFGGAGFSAAAGAGEVGDGGLRDAATTAADCIGRVDERAHQVLILLSDGLAGDQQEVVRGAYQRVGAAVPLVGGCAGDGLRMRATSQIHGRRVMRNSVVAAALSSDAPLGIGVRHGWRPVGSPMMVTSSAENRVFTLDDEPALDVYLRRLDAPAAVANDPEAFTHFAITHPLGLSRRRGEEVRFVGEANFDDRSLGCIAQVPQGALAWLMEGDDTSVLDATDAACSEALEALGDHPPLGMLAFDCIARRGVLGDYGVKREIDRINAHTHAPVAGFYTYGEIARTKGVSGFHNQTLVVLAVG
jgi:hypothetical protein